MGALHEGHRTLVRAARERAATVVVSVFVNPTQFGPGEDFDRYPRTWDADLAALAEEGADVVFHPPVDEVYPPGAVGVPSTRARWGRCSRAPSAPATSPACSPSSPSCSAWSARTSRCSARRTTSSSR